MDTFKTEPDTERSTEGRGCLGTDLKEATKRFEKGLNDSTTAVCEKLKEGRIAAERLLKHGRYAVEDGIEEATHQIKHHPLGSLAIAFAAGAALGFLIPHLGHKMHKPDPSY